ncbi:MAG: sialate O-acetylesterase [Lentisphaeria bacterium]|nr:sialate O-acetylesterase [Lentisphaeria bacterium]
MWKSRLTVLACVVLTGFTRLSAAQNAQALELAAPFTDNMILQRKSAVPVWGFDQPGNTVTVEFAGQKKTVVVDKRGDWMVRLEPLEASLTERPFTIANSAGESITLQGVLVGEVWFASGQSNMVWVAGKSMCGDIARELAGSEKDIPIREINIDTVSALYPQKKATSDGGWRKSKDASGFSALSLSFAYELYNELKVPVGILLSAHSNTRIEAFTQRQAIEAHPELTGDARLIHDADPRLEQGREAFEQYYSDLRTWQKEAGRLADMGGSIPAPPNLPGIAGMWRGPSQFFNGKIAPVVPYAIRGAIWCQGTSNSADGKIYAARMEALVNGWRAAWDMPEMPFYFTQMQCYGAPNPDSVGFADIRQAQHLFFINNRDHVGMVVQTDLNSARPGGIHYFNKLHPGMRLARWALAKDYGKDIAYTGPIFSGYEVKGGNVIVSFEQDSLFGGLMVGGKGMARDYRDPEKYVEPARPTPGETLNHFRLRGEDGKWHAAAAVIVGDTVVVTAQAVPKPVGVQYAYNAVPENSNLYNKAGLPATPFAAVNGKLIFQEDDKKPAAPTPVTAGPAPERPMLHVAEYYRPGVIIQRNKPVPVWGHANQGVTVTVTLGGVTRTATADDLEQWSVMFPPMKALAEPTTLTVDASNGRSRTVGDILVGDVWYLTGGTQLTSEWPYDPRAKEAVTPAAMPLVREFRRKTKASTSSTPRKRRFETGGGKYRSSWQTADYSQADSGVSMFAYQFAKALNRPGVPQGFITMSSGQGGRSPQMASPLSWTSFAGVKNISNPAFKARMDELFLQYPNTDVAQKALDLHIQDVQACVGTIVAAAQAGDDLSTVPQRFPAFPQPGGGSVKPDEIPTHAYNWCVSPLTPMAVAAVIWVPSEYTIGYRPAEYAAELEIYAKSLPATYGQDDVQLIYAHPAESLVPGLAAPKIPGAKRVTFETWPKSLKELAVSMAAQAE